MLALLAALCCELRTSKSAYLLEDGEEDGCGGLLYVEREVVVSDGVCKAGSSVRGSLDLVLEFKLGSSVMAMLSLLAAVGEGVAGTVLSILVGEKGGEL